VAAPALGPLLLRRLALARLRIEGPRIRIHAYPEGGDDIPKLGGGRGGFFDLRVRRLVIEDGELELDHRRVPLQLDLPDFRGRLARASRARSAASCPSGRAGCASAATPSSSWPRTCRSASRGRS